MLFNRKGQSALEYSVLLAIIVAAIVVMQIYIKRGVQGRLREATDDIGEQYDPGHQTYERFSDSTSYVKEATTTDGVTSQAIVQDMAGTPDGEQKTLRWGKTETKALNETEWGTPTN